MLILKSLIFVTIVYSTIAQQKPIIAVQYEWKYINFTWPSVEIYENTVKNNDYILENNALAGIKVWKEKLYLTIPRWKNGVPATVLATSANRPINGTSSPLLKPYPNWEMQEIGNCSAFQFVQSMEIDPMGRMWLLDTGRVATFTDDPKNYCPPRLVILDLDDNGKILFNYIFPEDVANSSTVYLNDIVLDHTDGGYAYITNTDENEPSIIVFSLRYKLSWKVTHPSMKATAVNFAVEYDNTKVTQSLNIDSIALSSASRKRYLYYSPLSSIDIFRCPTRHLKSSQQIRPNFRRLGQKPSQTDGMIMSADSRLYFGQLANNCVSSWYELNRPFDVNQFTAFKDQEQMQWPDTFAIDEKGVLWTVTNRLQRFLADKVDTNEINFRVLRLANLGSKSYLYYKNGEVPIYPKID